MILIPAIDLRGGKVVRWITGAPEQEIPYGDDPLRFASDFEKAGAEWIHVIDLDGARSGSPCNTESILKIRKATRLKIEVGGGLRTIESIDRLLENGIDRAIIGTKALEEGFLERVLGKHSSKIAVSMDVHEGNVKVAGWAQGTTVSQDAFVSQLSITSLAYLVFTNIARDGMMTGPDLQGLEALCRKVPRLKVILSGGVSSADDIRKVCGIAVPNLYGTIVGRALYEGKFSLEEALKITGEKVE